MAIYHVMPLVFLIYLIRPHARLQSSRGESSMMLVLNKYSHERPQMTKMKEKPKEKFI